MYTVVYNGRGTEKKRKKPQNSVTKMNRKRQNYGENRKKENSLQNTVAKRCRYITVSLPTIATGTIPIHTSTLHTHIITKGNKDKTKPNQQIKAKNQGCTRGTRMRPNRLHANPIT